jgi:hypothetical protein
MPNTETQTNNQNNVKQLPHKTYTARGQKRVLFTLGKGHDCTLMDVPADLYEVAGERAADADDSYVVECGLRPRADNEQLQALLADYLDQAKRHNAIPMIAFSLTAALEKYAAAAA